MTIPTPPAIRTALNTFQQAANRGTAVYLSLELVQQLRDALEAESDAEALAARPLLEQVAAMADCFGAPTVGPITAISSRAAAWLRQNPPGQPVAIEPKGCPTPGACSCVEPAPPAPELGEVPSDELMGQWKEECKRLSLESNYAIPASSFMAQRVVAWARQQQQAEKAALRGVPVAESKLDDAFMGGVCVSLALVTAHGEATIWREIVRSVGADNLLHYAANVNPDDWDLAGFGEYAQSELGKDKPLPAPQAGEVQPPRPTFLDAIRLAQGCHDYSGGHSGQQGEAFQDGVGTVVAVLKKAAVKPWDSQTTAVFAVGSAPQAGEGEAP